MCSQTENIGARACPRLWPVIDVKMPGSVLKCHKSISVRQLTFEIIDLLQQRHVGLGLALGTSIHTEICSDE